ncbi:hypothetical protein N7495_001472 [Penicillium taxi]|uniref:uncharacterized protein n=1 Tax=Penicillium taxi TaxID=168475 RepID=UPI002545A782|nr:uncharacterized protein N7495_001472 [Penicillium taxi]KAJ5908790.1 hypothetical protein N7495_001472 [Penicillium taxi]
MSGRTGKPAYFEEFDESSQGVVPDTRQSATSNTAAKMTRLDHRFHEPLIDGASDSGYSSRTAATAISSQSDPSGGKYPGPHKRDLPKQADLVRTSSLRKDRRDRPRTAHDETMPYGPYQAPAPHYAPVPPASSKSRRREQPHRRPYQGLYYDEHYQPAAQVDGPSDYPHTYFPPPPLPHSRQRYASEAIAEYQSSGRPRSMYQRYYNEPSRSVGWAQYIPHPSYGYEHAPPPFSAAWNHISDPYGPPGPSHHYAASDYGAPPQEYPRERSQSHAREPTRPRRGSYAPVESPDVSPDDYYDEDDPEQYYQERPAPRRAKDDEYDEDRREIPPPPPPAPSKPSKSATKVHQVKRPDALRKAQTTSAMPSQRRSSRAADTGRPLDMSDVQDALPDYKTRRVSREPRPERVNSLRESRRSQSYHDGSRGAQVVVENSGRRRQQQQYHPESRASMDLEYRERMVENYQASRNNHSTAVTPLSSETFLTKGAGSGSDFGSQKSRSNSSRASGGTSKAEKDMKLMVGGVAMSFMESELQGKSISITADDTGDMRLDISKGHGRRAPKKYVPGSSYSDYTDVASRREEDPRRTVRREARSERSSHRSAGSRYGQRYN